MVFQLKKLEADDTFFFLKNSLFQLCPVQNPCYIDSGLGRVWVQSSLGPGIKTELDPGQDPGALLTKFEPDPFAYFLGISQKFHVEIGIYLVFLQ